jgi:hypothetical protein
MGVAEFIGSHDPVDVIEGHQTGEIIRPPACQMQGLLLEVVSKEDWLRDGIQQIFQRPGAGQCCRCGQNLLHRDGDAGG